jgi:hypothetical protein
MRPSYNLRLGCKKKWEGVMMSLNDSTKTVSLTATLVALVLFMVWGGTEIIFEISKIPSWLRSVFFLGIILLPPIGLCIGWIKGFPRWVYPYAGGVLFMGLYMMNVSTPGFLFDREPWGWRAWIPFLLAGLISLVMTRSFQPLTSFFRNIWNDWTLATFALCGGLPLLIFIGFDETDALYSMIIITIVMLGMVTLYMQSHYQRNRVIVLLLGILSIITLILIGPIQEWHGSIDGLMLKIELVIFLIMFSPALIGLLRRLMKQPNPA